jgi:hypothetical protein
LLTICTIQVLENSNKEYASLLKSINSFSDNLENKLNTMTKKKIRKIPYKMNSSIAIK